MLLQALSDDCCDKYLAFAMSLGASTLPALLVVGASVWISMF